jgi:hypothetical protein
MIMETQMSADKIKLQVLKDYPTFNGMLYKDDIVYVEKKYESFLNEEKIKVYDATGKLFFIETILLKKII